MKYSYQSWVQNKTYNFHHISSKMNLHHWGRQQEDIPFGNTQSLNMLYLGMLYTNFDQNPNICSMNYRRRGNLELKRNNRLLGMLLYNNYLLNLLSKSQRSKSCRRKLMDQCKQHMRNGSSYMNCYRGMGICLFRSQVNKQNQAGSIHKRMKCIRQCQYHCYKCSYRSLESLGRFGKLRLYCSGNILQGTLTNTCLEVDTSEQQSANTTHNSQQAHQYTSNSLNHTAHTAM